MVYLVAYLWLIDAQDGAPAWWYVVLMVLAALSFAAAAPGTWAHTGLTVGLVISAPRDAGRLLSLGALLAPSVVAVALALVVTRPGAHPNGRTGPGARVNGASSEASHGAAEEMSSTFRLVSPSTMSQASGSDTDTTASPVGPLPNVRW